MISLRVPPENEIFEGLRGLGFKPTGVKTATGEFWVHEPSGRHIQVPFSVQGYYPDWLRAEFVPHALEVADAVGATLPKPPTSKGAMAKRRK